MKKVILLFCISGLFLLSGCRTIGGGIIVGGGHHHYQHSPMPPAHAPAHGRRQLHHYQYYPGAEFYFDVSRNMYFYLDSRGQWSFSVNLPLHLRSHLASGYVEIEMEEARPYLRHKDHRNKYRNHKSKSKHRHNNGHSHSDDRKYQNKRSYRNDLKYKKKSKSKSKSKYKEKKKRSKKGKYKNDDDEYDDRQKKGRKH